MKVTLVASTVVDYFALEDHTEYAPHGEGRPLDADELAEFAGRACYQSWQRPRPETATNEGYLSNIIGMGHESVLEHASATFYIEGVSRALTHELIRHRHLSFSELSQRFVNLDEAESVYPPASYHDNDSYVVEIIDSLSAFAETDYKRIYEALKEKDLSRKQAREAARSVLPNAMETKIVVTGNMRAWRDVLRKRWHIAADAEIRELAGELLRQLRGIAPNSFSDIPSNSYGSEYEG